jgi:hypothetical protein
MERPKKGGSIAAGATGRFDSISWLRYSFSG